MTDKLAPCIWYDKGQAKKAADFYMTLGLPDSRVDTVQTAPADNPSGKKGEELVVEFTLAGRSFVGLNGGPIFPQTEAVSNGGQESQCGWCKDRWGVNWQITPKRLLEFYTDPNPARAKAAFDAMMTMKKIDIAALEAAADQAG